MSQSKNEFSGIDSERTESRNINGCKVNIYFLAGHNPKAENYVLENLVSSFEKHMRDKIVHL